VTLRLTREADQFAKKLSKLLNATICHGVRLNAVVHPTKAVLVGYRISKTNYTPRYGVPVTCDGKKPSGYLTVSYKLTADDEGEHLMVVSSVTGYGLSADLASTLLHYDYERNKPDDYPEAHLQIEAQSPDWDLVCGRTGQSRSLSKLHLPVGGRRYRPTLEDLIEFLVVENIATARPNWDRQLKTTRDEFQRFQLGAAIRRDPETAKAALQALA
jgi:hypothetical protein